MLNLCSGWRLSILGRIAIVKTLALSKLVYYCFVLYTPTEFAKEVNKVILPFRWNFKRDKIKRNTLTFPISKGGLKMVNFADVEKSLKAAWVNRYCSSDGHHWCALLDSHLEKFGGSFLFQCNYDLKFLDLEGLPLFYRNILTVWQILHSKVPLSVNEIKEEILWNNRFIKIGGKTVFYKAWVSKGILRIKDILNAHDNFLSFQDLKDAFDIRGTLLDYGGLLAAIPKDLKKCYLTWQSGTHQRTDGDTTNRWKCFSKICSTNSK